MDSLARQCDTAPKTPSEQQQQQQQQQHSDGQSQQQQQQSGVAASSTSSNYIRSLVSKSSILLSSLKQQYSTAAATTTTTTQQQDKSPQRAASVAGSAPTPLKRASAAAQLSGEGSQDDDDEHDSKTTSPPGSKRKCDIGARNSDSATTSASSVSQQQQQLRHKQRTNSAASSCSSGSFAAAQQATQQQQPPPRPPVSPAAVRRARESMRRKRSNESANSDATTTTTSHSGEQRRHALQEQSLERDALLAHKSARADAPTTTKHKRTSSIKNVLRHASHFSPLRSVRRDKSAERLVACAASNASTNTGGSFDFNKAMPSECLFEPPVTQRAYERSRRRGAMMAADARRQMSVDTIALRQLTDEYLQNAGVKPATGSGLVALHPASATPPHQQADSQATQSEHCALPIETRLYKASKQSTMATDSLGSSDSLPLGSSATQLERSTTTTDGATTSGGGSNQVDVLPGNLPWQSDVSIQCELLHAPPLLGAACEEPYETTGDLLNTIALPFRGACTSTAAAAAIQAANSDASNLSATLKRGLSAISQHHLSAVAQPASIQAASAALHVVGSHLKKSLSNTLDISAAGAATSQAMHCVVAHTLHSQDSLPAYTSLRNEPAAAAAELLADSPPRFSNDSSTANNTLAADSCEQSGGFINQLASKLGRQSSKKFVVSKKGLHRALSFDCRGYKRLEGGQQQQQHQQQHSDNSKLLSAKHKHKSHNRSSNALNVAQINNDATLLPRPYIPQSASQVDFQLPLLPFDKMHEAIVSQRLIDKPRGAVANESSAAAAAACEEQQQQQQQTDEVTNPDELLCGQTPAHLADEPLAPSPLAATHSDDCEQQQQQQQQQCDEPEMRPSANTHTIRYGSRRKTPLPSLVVVAHAQGAQQQDAEQGEEASTHAQDLAQAMLDFGAPALPNSASFCINARGADSSSGATNGSAAAAAAAGSATLSCDAQAANGQHLLTANDVFARSQTLIKRPSTMLTDTQAVDEVVAHAIAVSEAAQRQQQAGVRRSRRQAIVPPKLVTDAETNSSDEGAHSCVAVGKLIDVDQESCGNDDDDDCSTQSSDASAFRHGGSRQRRAQQLERERAQSLRFRRKRSGGEPVAQSRPNLPTFRIESEGDSSACKQQQQQQQQPVVISIESATESPTICAHAPDSDAPTDSCASTRPNSAEPDAPESCAQSVHSRTGSAGNLFARSDSNAADGNNALNVAYLSPRGSSAGSAGGGGRRRSSIAVIPQMQICPGDLLVYSKQLIDRMNQDTEVKAQEQPPQFLTIDDAKKGKNIWSQFKLCAQFDTRTMRARNELLCSLEDVLASLQPSTFVDEQLSHYKGMLWDEFLYETESRRSASSDGLSIGDAAAAAAAASSPAHNGTAEQQRPEQRDTGREEAHLQNARSPLKVTVSSGGGSAAEPVVATPAAAAAAAATPGGGPAARIGSRWREKPKLKRGQTVDSVFRIPLVPCSPLKHAQQHQQTPTAHLEERDQLNTIQDDEERSSLTSTQTTESSTTLNAPGAGALGNSPRKSRSSKRASAASLCATYEDSEQQQQQQQNGSATQHAGDADSSFDNGDEESPPAQAKGGRKKERRAFVRQSSLSTLSSTVTRTEQKRQRALWDLFQSECTFFFDHLMTLKNVYMEPLKKIQVEGFAMFADPDVLFGNLDELCCGVYDFCKEFLYIIMRTLKTRPEELNATDVLIKLYKKNPKIEHLRAVYHRYTLNYINALTYLESLRKQVEFVEFEKWSSRDVRCKKLQLTDLLVAPVQHIMRVPIILRDIETHTEHARDRDEIRAILAVEEASLRELDDKMRWLKNFERLLEIQKSILWPNVMDLDAKLFVPEFLRDVLSKQPCEKLIVSPRRQIVHEGVLANLDTGKPSDMHVILFDDMLLLTRRKKGLTKKASTVCKTTGSSSSHAKHHHHHDDGSFKYVVYRQPLSLDRFYVHDVQQVDAQSIGMKFLFLLIVMNRFQQITNVHSFSAQNDDIKQTWLFKIKKTIERWKRSYAADQQQASGNQNNSSAAAADKNKHNNNNLAKQQHNNHVMAESQQHSTSAMH